MLFDQTGRRKYLTASEHRAFVIASRSAEPIMQTFLLTLAYTGARISEVLATTPKRVDVANRAIIFECLKRRKKGIYRAVPIPNHLLELLQDVHGITARYRDVESQNMRLWPWSRTTGWHYVKRVMAATGIQESLAMPKSLRHAFGVEGTVIAKVPLGVVQKWMGHSRIETTAIYANAVGAEERALAAQMWT